MLHEEKPSNWYYLFALLPFIAFAGVVFITFKPNPNASKLTKAPKVKTPEVETVYIYHEPKPCSDDWLDDKASHCRWSTFTKTGELQCMAKLQLQIARLCNNR